MLRVSRVIVAAVMMRGALRVRIAQHDYGAAINRHEHEAHRNQRTKAEHCENEPRHPLAGATGS
jgi:hypothetical protein